MVLSKEALLDIHAAHERLKLRSLDEASLVEQLKLAQQHNPATGFYMDTAAVCAIREEIDRRKRVQSGPGGNPAVASLLIDMERAAA